MCESADIGRQSIRCLRAPLIYLENRGAAAALGQAACGMRFRRAAVVEPPVPLWHIPPALDRAFDPGCRSSVVEHSLGKGEVDSSILSGSTIHRLRPGLATSSFSSIAAALSCPSCAPRKDR